MENQQEDPINPEVESNEIKDSVAEQSNGQDEANPQFAASQGLELGSESGMQQQQETISGEDSVQAVPVPLVPTLTKGNLLSYLRELRWSPVLRSHAYVKLLAPGVGFEEIEALKEIKHIQDVDLSNNLITDITPLNGMPDLAIVNLSGNKLEAFTLPDSPVLLEVDLSQNLITKFPVPWTGGVVDNLMKLNLAGNMLATIQDLPKMPNLTSLCLRGNQLTVIGGVTHLGKLKSLFMAKNELTSLAGTTSFPSLTCLHLRENKISTLEGLSADLTDLQKLNLRKNEVSVFNEIRKLQVLPKLTDLNLLDNPVCVNSTYRLDVILALPGLKRLDKIVITAEEKKKALRLTQDRELEQKLFSDAEKHGEKKEEEWLQWKEEQAAKEVLDQARMSFRDIY
eukprot:TRINITY_DN4416_c0_g4_i4.p1 TRINITY_DN4416_c0_g4~~TRINITY_DN4416_c0_g4_i4.p1  ORF type:complete len:397 (+),score=87.60 TRINITY_DN4416_c0_g4_i4:119-1309(+)